MKDTGILFTPENYGKCAEGTKTQTRRIVRLPPAPIPRVAWEATTFGGPHGGKTRSGETLPERPGLWQPRNGRAICCPWSVGDRLWAKEGLCKSPGGLVQYRRGLIVVGWAAWEWQRNTLSPIHMPHRFARLWLEITEVRVQRLQEISEEDASAEGALFLTGEPGENYRRGFCFLWESIYGVDSWAANPWLWAISFKVVKS